MSALKKMDRLFAILIALQQRPETAQSLAHKFEVSKRTILRDMQSLSEIGIPVYSLTGPRGGFRLMDGFTLPPLQLDTQEAFTVLFSLEAMTKIADTPFNQARWTVLDKIKSILPESARTHIESALQKIEVEVPKRNYTTPHLQAMLDYTTTSTWLCVYYRSMNHRRWLTILPERIFTASGFWYCEAYSVTHEENRTFRVDRLDEVEEIDTPDASIPKHVKTNNEDTDEGTRVRATLTYKGLLQMEQDVHIGERTRDIGNDRWEVDFVCPASEWSWAVTFFFSLGRHAHVTEPERLRNEIRQRARQLLDHYGNNEEMRENE